MLRTFHLTDEAPDDAVPAPKTRQQGFRKYALMAAQLTVFLLLIDGVIDIAYPATRAVKRVILPEPAAGVGGVPEAQLPKGWDRYRHRELPGLGHVVDPVTSPELNVDSFGRRATGNPAREEGPHGVLLGSSQAFGFLVADEATLAAAIERRRGNVSVTNISGPGRGVAETMTNWQRVAADIRAPDFGILLFSSVELAKSCWARKATKAQNPALIGMLTQAREYIRKQPPVLPCHTQEARDAAVERAIYEVHAALAYGRAQTPHFAIVIAPLVYGNAAKVDALLSNQDPAAVKSMDLTVRAFRKRLAAERIPGVIDLSGAFDGEQPYFIDESSHFGRLGADRLAELMLQRLPDDMFVEAKQ